MNYFVAKVCYYDEINNYDLKDNKKGLKNEKIFNIWS